jgi:endo-1,4-beta-xylanase
LRRREFLHGAARVGVGAAVSALGGCRRVVVQAPTAASLGPADLVGVGSLGARAAAKGLLYGCAVNVAKLDTDAEYAGLVRAQARIAVAENSMKWGTLRPGASEFRFDEADAFVAFAEANGMKIRGHNLAWHRNNPAWFDGGMTAANGRELLVKHIETVAGRYAGRMHSWDVVNEAVLVTDGRADGLRKSVWLEMVGDDYIEVAFKTARNADPQALLTYNDYGIEEESAAAEQKRQAVLVLLRRMKARGVPIDAMGVQSHIEAGSGARYGAGLMRFLASVRELGLQVFLSEMDVNDRKLSPDEQGRDAAVAAAYKGFLELTLAEPAVRAVLTWGITDRYTWLNRRDARLDRLPERALPFDAECRAKAAAYAMRGAFEGRRVGAA